MEAAAAEAPLVDIADSDDAGATASGAPFCPRWAMKANAMDWSCMKTVSFSLLTTTSAGERRPHAAREAMAYAWKPWYWMHRGPRTLESARADHADRRS